MLTSIVDVWVIIAAIAGFVLGFGATFCGKHYAAASYFYEGLMATLGGVFCAAMLALSVWLFQLWLVTG